MTTCHFIKAQHLSIIQDCILLCIKFIITPLHRGGGAPNEPVNDDVYRTSQNCEEKCALLMHDASSPWTLCHQCHVLGWLERPSPATCALQRPCSSIAASALPAGRCLAAFLSAATLQAAHESHPSLCHDVAFALITCICYSCGKGRCILLSCAFQSHILISREQD